MKFRTTYPSETPIFKNFTLYKQDRIDCVAYFDSLIKERYRELKISGQELIDVISDFFGVESHTSSGRDLVLSISPVTGLNYFSYNHKTLAYECLSSVSRIHFFFNKKTYQPFIPTMQEEKRLLKFLNENHLKPDEEQIRILWKDLFYVESWLKQFCHFEFFLYLSYTAGINLDKKILTLPKAIDDEFKKKEISYECVGKEYETLKGSNEAVPFKIRNKFTPTRTEDENVSELIVCNGLYSQINHVLRCQHMKSEYFRTDGWGSQKPTLPFTAGIGIRSALLYDQLMEIIFLRTSFFHSDILSEMSLDL